MYSRSGVSGKKFQIWHFTEPYSPSPVSHLLLILDLPIADNQGQTRHQWGREGVSEVLICYSLGVSESQSTLQRNQVTL
jgi:hypothetical protein